MHFICCLKYTIIWYICIIYIIYNIWNTYSICIYTHIYTYALSSKELLIQYEGDKSLDQIIIVSFHQYCKKHRLFSIYRSKWLPWKDWEGFGENILELSYKCLGGCEEGTGQAEAKGPLLSRCPVPHSPWWPWASWGSQAVEGSTKSCGFHQLLGMFSGLTISTGTETGKVTPKVRV